MGFLDKLRAAKAMAEAVYETVPHWARIVDVGRRVGPMLSLELEIHSGTNPPFVVNSLSWPPRGFEPVIGTDVAFRLSTADDRDHYAVVWDRPPQYGRPPHGGRPADARPLIEPPPESPAPPAGFRPPPGFGPPPGYPQPGYPPPGYPPPPR